MEFISNYLSSDNVRIITGVIVILLGIMYMIKGIICFTNDRIAFWDGLPKVNGLVPNALIMPIKIPLMLISLFIINWQPDPKSLISEAHGMIVMFILGPFFIFLSLGLFVYGADKLELNGAQNLNLVLNGFNQQQALSSPYIIYSEYGGYRYPAIDKIGESLTKFFSKEIK